MLKLSNRRSDFNDSLVTTIRSLKKKGVYKYLPESLCCKEILKRFFFICRKGFWEKRFCFMTPKSIPEFNESGNNAITAQFNNITITKRTIFHNGELLPLGGRNQENLTENKRKQLLATITEVEIQRLSFK